MNLQLDATDHQLIAALQGDARLTMSELGRRLNLSQPAVTERVRKLEGAGVITGYHAQIDPSKLGYALRAIVRLSHSDCARVSHAVQAMPEVRNAFNVTGEDSWVVEIAVRDVAHLDDLLQAFAQLGEPATSVILRAVAEGAPLRPADAVAGERARSVAKTAAAFAPKPARAPATKTSRKTTLVKRKA